MEDWRIAMGLLMGPGIVNSAYYGPAYACVQGLVRPQARAVAASNMLFGQNLIGLGFGPFLFGVLSDALAPTYGEESVRYVLYGAAWLGLIRSEEHTSELQSLMRTSYAVFCLKKKNKKTTIRPHTKAFNKPVLTDIPHLRTIMLTTPI